MFSGSDFLRFIGKTLRLSKVSFIIFIRKHMISCSEWFQSKTWTFCQDCGLVQQNTMLPNFHTAANQYVKNCPCTIKRYPVPRKADYDENFTVQDQQCLRIFRVDTGDYRRPQHEYRQRTRPISLIIVLPLVEDRISDLEGDAHHRVSRKFNLLMQNPHYREYYTFVLEQVPLEQIKVPYYKIFRRRHIEIAIWPLLYIKPEWCESAMEGGNTRLSSKRAFHIKAMSFIADFGQDFSLLQYQYDRWLFKTVTGAVESGRVYGTSPHRALETKTFTTSYWQ